MKLEDKSIISFGLIAIGLAILLFIVSCISKIPCDKEKFDPKLIALCASKGYQDKIASLCIENDFLQDELTKCRNTNLRNSDIITNYLNEIDILKKLLTDCNNKRNNEIAELERKLKKLYDKAGLLSEQLKGKNEAIKNRDKEIEKLEKNK